MGIKTIKGRAYSIDKTERRKKDRSIDKKGLGVHSIRACAINYRMPAPNISACIMSKMEARRESVIMRERFINLMIGQGFSIEQAEKSAKEVMDSDYKFHWRG